MRNDWDLLRDKGPQVEERNRNWKNKKSRGKKLFAIEGKYIGRTNAYGGTLEDLFRAWREWHIIRKYRTEKQRDMALDTLVRKERTPTCRTGRWEYRKHGEVENNSKPHKKETNDEKSYSVS